MELPEPDDTSTQAYRARALGVAVRLRELREQAGNPTLETIVARSGCSLGAVSNALSGKAIPSDETWDRLLRVLGAQPGENLHQLLRNARRARRIIHVHESGIANASVDEQDAGPGVADQIEDGQSDQSTGESLPEVATQEPIPPKRPKISWVKVVGILAAVVLIGAVVAFALHVARSSARPPATTTYVLYRSTDSADIQLGGGALVLRESSDPPPTRYEYRPVGLLGLGPAVEPTASIAGTHLVYNFFCSGMGDPSVCNGVLRSHYFSTSSQAPEAWNIAASYLGPVARLYDTDSRGNCRVNQRAVYRFERGTETDKQFALGINAPSGEWIRTEHLGCLAAPKP